MLREPIPDVALVAPYPRFGEVHGGHSGVASYTANLARSLRDNGVRVTVIAPAEPGEPTVGSDAGIVVRRAFEYGPRALSRALGAGRATGAGVVHLQHELFLYGGPAAMPGLVAGLAGGRRPGSRRRAGTVVTMHQVVDPRDVSPDYTRMHRVGVPAGVARVGISAVQRAVRVLADTVVVHEQRFAEIVPGAVTVPHGLERAAEPTDRARVRRELGLGDGLVALCFGFVAPYKGLEAAGEAAGAVGDRVQVVIAGGPHPRLEKRHGYAAELRQRYGEHVRFTGYVPDEDVHRWFAAADLIVLPYPTPHASSGALALALAHGKPVLASSAMARTCGLPATVGFDRADELAERLRRLAAEPAELRKLGDAVTPLRDERGWDTVARRHIDLYRNLTAA